MIPGEPRAAAIWRLPLEKPKRKKKQVVVVREGKTDKERIQGSRKSISDGTSTESSSQDEQAQELQSQIVAETQTQFPVQAETGKHVQLQAALQTGKPEIKVAHQQPQNKLPGQPHDQPQNQGQDQPPKQALGQLQDQPTEQEQPQYKPSGYTQGQPQGQPQHQAQFQPPKQKQGQPQNQPQFQLLDQLRNQPQNQRQDKPQDEFEYKSILQELTEWQRKDLPVEATPWKFPTPSNFTYIPYTEWKHNTRNPYPATLPVNIPKPPLRCSCGKCQKYKDMWRNGVPPCLAFYFFPPTDALGYGITTVSCFREMSWP